MDIKTKYGFGLVVFKITRRQTSVWSSCPMCGVADHMAGRVALASGKLVRCPEHDVRRLDQFSPWTVGGAATIRNVKVDLYAPGFGRFGRLTSNPHGPDDLGEISYMCEETGVGSGAVHREGTLWPSLEAAQAECDRLNAADKTARPSKVSS